MLLIAAAPLLSSGPSAQSARDWPSWRGPNRDGKSLDSGLLKEWPDDGPLLLWTVDSIGRGFSSVAVADGAVYTTGDFDGRLFIFAFDLNGNLKWKADHDKACTLNPPGSRSTPTISDGLLYIISGYGLVGCYDIRNGKPVWTRSVAEFGGAPPDAGCAESVLIYNNLAIITPGGDKCLAALNKADGSTVWTTAGYRAQAQYASPIAFVHQGLPLIVTGTKEGLVCVRADDGKILWSNPWCAGNTFNCTTPVYADGYLFWSNGSRIKGGICLKLEGSGTNAAAREVWTTSDFASFHGGYVIHDGFIYGNHANGWACIDVKTGVLKTQARAIGRGSLCFADGMLYLFGERAGVAALMTCSPEALQIKGQFSVKGTGPSYAHPVVAGGRLYLRYENNLYCYRVSAN